MADSNWFNGQLGDILTLQRGYDLPKSKRTEGNVPIVSSSGTSGSHREAKVEAPGVVTGRYGTLGEVFFMKEDFWPLNTTLYVKDFKNNDPLFLSYFLKTLNLASQNAAGAVPGLNRNALHLLPVRVPHPKAQRKIATILSAYDNLIENNTRRIKILEEMAQTIYREWFVNFRFPGHEKVKMVDSPLGEIPEGWEVVKLADVAEVNAKSIRKGNIPDIISYIDISSVSTGSVDKVEEVIFSDAPSRARRIVHHGDVIWATVRPNRKSYSLILKPSDDLIVSTGFAVLSPKKVPYTYLYQAVTTEDFVAYLVNNATGAAYPAVNAGEFNNADMILPSEDVLALFHVLTEGQFLLKHNLKLKNKNLRQTRDLLLPKLISGEIDLSDLKIETKETAA